MKFLRHSHLDVVKSANIAVFHMPIHASSITQSIRMRTVKRTVHYTLTRRLVRLAVGRSMEVEL